MGLTIPGPATTIAENPVSDKALKEAICLKCTNCYGAMAFVNALGGTLSDAWLLCHKYPLRDLLQEADARNLSLAGLVSADKKPVEDTLYYKRARGVITEVEFQKLFHEWQQGR